jgi:methyl-accepting chemotaxis protein
MVEISEASREQTSGIEQVSLAVNQMDDVTQQNAALVEEAAAAAESLEEQARSLSRSVAVFRLPGDRAPEPNKMHLAHRERPQLAATKSVSPPILTARTPKKLPSAQISTLSVQDDDEWTEF